jgi:spore germination cell wall hydrolase CwlJ-like protein
MIAATAIEIGMNQADLAIDTVARTIWAEARGEGEAGMTAVAAVIRNRLELSTRLGGRHWWGSDWIGVCRARGQFAAWKPANPNRAKLLTVGDADPDFRLAKRIAADTIAGKIPDPTFGATAYKLAAAPWPYSWGHFRLPLIEIGRHGFYNLAEP